MNEAELLKKLSAAARREPPPRIDVTAAVSQRLAADRSRDTRYAPLAIFTLASCAAAVAISVVAVRAWLEWQDPFGQLLSSMNVVMQ